MLGTAWARLRAVRPPPIHAFLLPPDKTTFALTGDQGAPIALSADGENAVFGASGQLWVQSLRTGAVAALAGAESGQFPFWSPDGRRIGFFGGGKLKTIDAAGGSARIVCDAPTPRGGTWGPDETIVFAPDFRGGLYRVASSGGTPAPVTTLDTKRHSTHRWPWFLADGRHFIYLAADHANPRSEEAAVYAASLDGGEPRRLLPGPGSAVSVPGWLLTVQGESLMATPFDARRLAVTGPAVRVAGDAAFDAGTWRGVVAASQTGVLAYQIAREGLGGQLVWLDFSGRTLSTVGERSESYSLKLSPDGRRASMLLGDPNNDIWVYELDRGVRTRLTTDAQVITSPVWSPDGSQILFVSTESIASKPSYLMETLPSLGAGERKEVMRSPERIEPTDWSRDGRYVLVDRGNIGATDIWAVPVAEPDKAFPVVQTPSWEGAGAFSPDGRWLAYGSLQTGTFEIYVMAFPGGARWQVSGQGGWAPRWSPDGKTLYFLSFDGMLMGAPVDGSGKGLEVGSAKPLFPVNVFTGPRQSPAYEIAPDGKRLLVNLASESQAARVALVANWPSGLPR